jgi:hypothetical protein
MRHRDGKAGPGGGPDRTAPRWAEQGRGEAWRSGREAGAPWLLGNRRELVVLRAAAAFDSFLSPGGEQLLLNLPILRLAPALGVQATPALAVGDT